MPLPHEHPQPDAGMGVFYSHIRPLEVMRISVRTLGKPSPRRWVLWLVLLSVSVVVVFIVCLSFGAVAIGPWQTLRILVDRAWPLTQTWSPSEQIIILHVRAPRILLAACVGAALAVAGTIFQALLRNPLADPYVLGISGGAAVGVMLATMSGLNTIAFGLSPCRWRPSLAR